MASGFVWLYQDEGLIATSGRDRCVCFCLGYSWICLSAALRVKTAGDRIARLWRLVHVLPEWRAPSRDYVIGFVVPG
jgi:hypothetical protein